MTQLAFIANNIRFINTEKYDEKGKSMAKSKNRGFLSLDRHRGGTVTDDKR